MDTATPSRKEQTHERIVEAAAHAGASSIHYTTVRLPWEVRPLFKEWLAHHVPEKAERIMARVRDLRGGKEYDAQWGKRMKGEGPIAALMSRRFAAAKARYGLDFRFDGMDLSQFRVPPRAGDQIDLFG